MHQVARGHETWSRDPPSGRASELRWIVQVGAVASTEGADNDMSAAAISSAPSVLLIPPPQRCQRALDSQAIIPEQPTTGNSDDRLVAREDRAIGRKP